MPLVSSFEILSLKKGKWEVEAVVDNKVQAITQAEQLLHQGFFSAIEVIEERYDEETGESHSLVIYNKVKVLRKTREQYTGPERRKGKEWRQNPKKYGRETKKKARKGRKRRNATFGELMVRGSLILLLILFLGILAITYVVENLK
ncbi:MAG: hypothetical protein H8E36_03965 [Rhodospirillaceae bacterium]|nr:hypothetical protein [Rhodospirillaceae bacterium]MBL6930035.1 hypothetical protein [Rhodospirillales bacterium]MBL6940941.1 hypothetical protein [Rhodospirillales bacterium]